MMAVTKEQLSDFKECYEKAGKLISEESKLDPQSEPYRSHYKAREILLELKENLKNEIISIEAEGEHGGEVDYVYRVISATVCCQLGRINVYTEETQSGESYLNECIDILNEYKLRKEAILPFLRALNEIATVYANRQSYKESFDKLIEAEELYFAYKKSDGGEPFTIYDVLNAEEVGNGAAKLESLYTHCTFYLAQVYGHLGELAKSAHYCHITLKRQLEAKSYESIDFALNAATLSQYYVGQNMFAEAKHHLAAATFIMDEREKNLITPDMSEQQISDIIETHKHRCADIARCWAKYGLALLTASQERLYEDDEVEDDDGTKAMEKLEVDPMKHRFPNLDLSEYEKRITDEYCLTFDDAKKVYHFTIQWLDKAKEYYTPETEATEYAKIIKDYAELYSNIAFFEEDPNNQCKMHKRRAKYYEDLLELLNPVFYLNICRECWYGASMAYITILGIKLDLLKESNTGPKQSEIQKINQSSNKSIDYMKKFVASYMGKDGKELNPNLQVEDVRLVLFAYFRLGHLYFKLMSNDPAVQFENLTNSLKYYTLFLDECAKNEEAATTMQSEIGVSKEIQGLLPLQLSTIKKRLSQ